MRGVWLLVFCSFGAMLAAQEPTEAAIEKYPYHELDAILPEVTEAARLTLQFRRSGLLQRALPHVDVRCDCPIRAEELSVPLREAIRKLDAAVLDEPEVRRSAPTVCTGILLDGARIGLVRWRVGTNHVVALLHQDPVSGAIASAYLQGEGVWDRWHQLPRLQQTDLDGDGTMEVVLDVHHHNGTVEDWDARHYLVPRGPGFRSVLTLATGVRHVMSPRECGETHQFVIADSPTQVRVYTWYDNACLGPSYVPLGVITLQREGCDQPFREVERTAWLRQAECHLDTRTPSYPCLR